VAHLLVGIPTKSPFKPFFNSLSHSLTPALPGALRGCLRTRRNIFQGGPDAFGEDLVRALHGDFARWCGVSHRRPES
jgi:hypothetical protein